MGPGVYGAPRRARRDTRETVYSPSTRSAFWWKIFSITSGL